MFGLGKKEATMIKLGSKVRDTLTGFDGIAVSRTEWLYGCARIGIEPDKLDKDGAPMKMEYFDEQRVETVKRQKPTVSKESSARSGGPQRDPARRENPR